LAVSGWWDDLTEIRRDQKACNGRRETKNEGQPRRGSDRQDRQKRTQPSARETLGRRKKRLKGKMEQRNADGREEEEEAAEGARPGRKGL
jgi:hypothetical protein